MELQINTAEPMIMHIDLNSCFAIIEQQANPLIRHKPVAVAAYGTGGGMVLASSYEAKALGIKLGVNVRQAMALSKDLIVLMPDPEKYFDAHRRFKKVLLAYTSNVVPKSVDEFVVDFTGSAAIRQGNSLRSIGYQIKQDIKDSLGEYVTVNVGIGPNRFLAKLAAGLHKPDGLDVITGENLQDIYASTSLLALPGINKKYKARLNMAGIYTPLDFLNAPVELLKKQVFKGIMGHYWYMRLRGHEIDAIDFGRKSFGHQYALGQKTTDPKELKRLFMKLCEKTGRRLRAHGSNAGGVYVGLLFENHTSWGKGTKTDVLMYSTQDIYAQVCKLLQQVVIPARVTNISMSVHSLTPANPQQLGIFDDSRLDTHSIAHASDIINDRYGEFTLVPAIMTNMQDTILKRVAFGNVKGLSD